MPRSKARSTRPSRKTARPTDDAAIALAALTCTAGGWPAVSLAAVARAASMALPDLERRVGNRNGLVPLMGQYLDADLPARVSGSVHDQLFDLMMARFDAMQAHRAAITSMEAAARRDPGLARALLCATRTSMARIADAVRADKLPPRLLMQAGVTAIHAAAFFAWRRDDSRDMGRTMAALDRALRWAGMLVERLPV